MPPVSGVSGLRKANVVELASPSDWRKSTAEPPAVSGVGCPVPRLVKVAV